MTDLRRDAPKQLVSWPVKEQYVRDASRFEWVDLWELVLGVVIFGSVLGAIFAMLFLVAGLAQ